MVPFSMRLVQHPAPTLVYIYQEEHALLLFSVLEETAISEEN